MLQILIGLVIAVGALMLAFPQILKQISKQAVRREVAKAHHIAPEETDPLLADLDPHRPTLLYFTADWCGPCRTTQTPIVDQLVTKLGDTFQLRKVDVDANRESATRWKVNVLPRTIILRPGFSVHAANVGVATEHTLVEQIKSATTTTADAPIFVTQQKEPEDAGPYKFKFRE